MPIQSYFHPSAFSTTSPPPPLVPPHLNSHIPKSFHWFANSPSLHEIGRVLTPTGSLGLLWNIEAYNQTRTHPSTSWEAVIRNELFALDEKHGLEQTRWRHQRWREVFRAGGNSSASRPDGSQEDEGSGRRQGQTLFDPRLGETTIEWAPVFLSREELWQRVRTLSCVNMLRGAEMEAMERLFGKAVEGDDVERDGEGRIAVHGVTMLAWTGKV
jgi:hypothetical protein